MLEKHSHALRDDFNDARKSVKRKIASRTNPTTYKQICKTHKLQIQVCRREIQGRQVVRQTGQSMASMQARLVCRGVQRGTAALLADEPVSTAAVYRTDGEGA